MPDTSGAPRRPESGSPALQAAGTLWLVRHGESGWNVARRIQGQSPGAPGLTAAGRSQAAEAALELARRAPRADRIMASDLARTAETAEIIAARLRLPVAFDPGLREQSLGILEGRSVFAAAGADGADGAENSGSSGAAESGAAEGGAERDLLIAFWEDPFRTPPGGENIDRDVGPGPPRVGPDRRVPPGADLIVVTHGGPVRVGGGAPAGARPGVPAHGRRQRVHHALPLARLPRGSRLAPSPETGFAAPDFVPVHIPVHEHVISWVLEVPPDTVVNHSWVLPHVLAVQIRARAAVTPDPRRRRLCLACYHRATAALDRSARLPGMIRKG